MRAIGHLYHERATEDPRIYNAHGSKVMRNSIIIKIMTYYTITGKTDGFGAQYQSILSGIAFCKYTNYIYVHSPFTQIEHNVDIRKANEFIGITNVENVPQKCNIIKEPYSPEVHWCRNPSMYYTEQVLEYIRTCYFSTPKPHADIDIAIHIRRGDVSNIANTDRYTDNSYYANIIKKMKALYPSYSITIFSEGTYDDFKDLGLAESCFRLNTDVFETFHSLVCSKVLITAKSSFSYCAGIINRNTVYYDTFWHKKLDHWINI